MRYFFMPVLIVALLVGASMRTVASVDDAPAPVVTSQWELVVVEATGCIYCGLFRRDLFPAYNASEQGKQMPVRFVDVNAINNNHLDLQSPINVVPTFVVVKSNHEIGRISGYMGPEDFFHSIKYLLSSAP
jgi:thioredoxin-related protein